MLIVGFCKMHAATGNELYKNAAIECIQWLEENLYHKEAHYFYHSIANGTPKATAFLDDYANLIQAYIQLQEMTGSTNYLIQAKNWMNKMKEEKQKFRTIYQNFIKRNIL